MQSVNILIVLIFTVLVVAAERLPHKLRLDNKIDGDVPIEAKVEYELNGQLNRDMTVRFDLARYETLVILDGATNIRFTITLFSKSGDKIKDLQQPLEWPMKKRLLKRFIISGTASEPKLELVETLEF